MRKPQEFFVYITVNQRITVFYVGTSNNLIRRTWKHKKKHFDNAFTKKYNVDKLVYYESYSTLNEAIKRERQIKKWSRKKKINLIKTMNPEFRDLSDDWWHGKL